MMSKSRVQMILCPPSPLHFKKWGDKSPLAAPPLPPLSDASNIYIYIFKKYQYILYFCNFFGTQTFIRCSGLHN